MTGQSGPFIRWFRRRHEPVVTACGADLSDATAEAMARMVSRLVETGNQVQALSERQRPDRPGEPPTADRLNRVKTSWHNATLDAYRLIFRDPVGDDPDD